jgi:NAD(P)-dependent dehydrogenase (short-subunit alcohol dehydrogenase family)
VTGEKQIHVPRQDGRTAIVTGTGGLGFEVALALARAGADVILAGRNRRKGEQAVAEITAQAPSARVRFEALDLASLPSVAEFAEVVARDFPAVDILICNAGIMSPPERRTTADGMELQFGVNYLGHFALVAALLPQLRQSASPRVVSVTSLAHRYAKVDFGDLQSERKYKPGLAYCRSKLAQAMFAKELQRRSSEEGWGLTSVAAHPGYARTNLFQGDQARMGLLKAFSTKLIGIVFGHSAAAGAAPIIHAATSPDVTGGELYGPTGLLDMKGPPGRGEFAAVVDDRPTSARLWSISEELAGMRFPLARGAAGEVQDGGALPLSGSGTQ